MTDKNIDKAKGRVKGAASARTGGRRPQNKGRVDQAEELCQEGRGHGRRHPHRPQEGQQKKKR